MLPPPWRPCAPLEHVKIGLGVSEKIFLRISSCPHSVKSLAPTPSHGGHVFRRIKNSRTIFEKGHPRNNPLASHFRGEEF